MANDVRVVECKNCEARYKVPATVTAHKMQCKRCKSPIFLNVQTATRGRRPTTRRATRVRGNPPPKKASMLQVLSGVLCLVIIGVLIFFISTIK